MKKDKPVQKSKKPPAKKIKPKALIPFMDPIFRFFARANNHFNKN